MEEVKKLFYNETNLNAHTFVFYLSKMSDFLRIDLSTRINSAGGVKFNIKIIRKFLLATHWKQF